MTGRKKSKSSADRMQLSKELTKSQKMAKILSGLRRTIKPKVKSNTLNPRLSILNPVKAMSDIAIRVENLSKLYKIGIASRRHDTLRDQTAAALKALFQRNGNSPSAKDRQDTFWALEQVSFEVKTGEVVGIIGSNGAGKSTLLKILSRITPPTSGRVDIHGRVGSLLEVGTGFHPELTGRENIYLNGAILGMKKAELERKFDEIVAFSGVERFMDTPVKRYSSGMYVRLAFAIAAHLEPEILIVDEVLAVGDASFQEKCLGKMEDAAREGRTVLFVSHNMAAVRNLCSRAILLKNGRIDQSGAVEDVVRAYLMVDVDDSYSTLEERQDRAGTGMIRAVSFEATIRNGSKAEPARTGGPADFIIGYVVHQERPIKKLYASIGVTNSSGVGIFACSTAMLNADFSGIVGEGKVVCQIDYLPLIPGKYSVNIKLAEDQGQSNYVIHDEIMHAATFDVVESGDSGFIAYSRVSAGNIIVPHKWMLQHLAE
jgi:lipopolysaccharide transport system ATP-binding protein